MHTEQWQSLDFQLRLSARESFYNVCSLSVWTVSGSNPKAVDIGCIERLWSRTLIFKLSDGVLKMYLKCISNSYR